jgi:hypothetical protein
MIYYVALPFVRSENGGLVQGEAVECPHSSAVLRHADAMYRSGAVPTLASIIINSRPSLQNVSRSRSGLIWSG